MRRGIFQNQKRISKWILDYAEPICWDKVSCVCREYSKLLKGLSQRLGGGWRRTSTFELCKEDSNCNGEKGVETGEDKVPVLFL